MVNNLDHAGINIYVSKKDCSKIEHKNNTCINAFCYKNNLAYPVYVSDQKFKDCMDFLLITEGNKSHCVYIKDFNRFMCNRTKNNNKKYFCRYCLQCFNTEKVLTKHKENCLIIDGKQTVKLKSGSTRFKNHFKQLAVPFKKNANFEPLLKGI